MSTVCLRRLSIAAIVALCAVASAAAAGDQPTFEKTVADLTSRDVETRLKAVQLLKGAAYPEAAVPLAGSVMDPVDDIQLEAIAAELNIFLADRVTPKKRVGLLVEVRGRIEAEPTFAAGPSVLGPARVPREVVAALATASRDANARVAVEALYAFGALAGEVVAPDRPAVLKQSGPLLAATIGATDPVLRLAAVRVIGRTFAHRNGDAPVDEAVGDAVIMALNDRETVIQQTAMWALGAMRYERAIQGLNELFQYHQRGPMATSAFDALAHIAHASSLPQFEQQLAAKNSPLKMLAIEGIARVGDKSRLEHVQRAIADEKNDAVLLAAHFANVMLGDGTVDVIVEALGRSKLHDQAWQYVYEAAPGRTAAFARHLQGDARLRVDLIDALGLAGDPAVVPSLEPFAKDKDDAVSRAAQRAIMRLNAKPS